jgi:hypothetical protein
VNLVADADGTLSLLYVADLSSHSGIAGYKDPYRDMLRSCHSSISTSYALCAIDENDGEEY